MDQEPGRGQKKLDEPNPAADTAPTNPPARGETRSRETQPAEEWGGRENTGKVIESGGKHDPAREGTP